MGAESHRSRGEMAGLPSIKKEGELKMKMKLVACLAIVLFMCGITGTANALFMLDFEGLQDLESVETFYDGGSGSMGSTGTDYGVTFSSNGLAIIDEDEGGSGNFGGEPSPDTVLFFLSGTETRMTVDGGFDTGFSFYYSSIEYVGSIDIYDINDLLLASMILQKTPYNGAPDPTGEFSPFVALGVDFDGTASYVDFGGSANKIGFDNITFGSETPVGAVPEPSTILLVGIGLLGLAGYSRKRLIKKN